MSTLMLLSSSYVYKGQYLGYCSEEITAFLTGRSRMLFVPFAYKDHEGYTDHVRNVLGDRIEVTGAHTLAKNANIAHFDVVFCGGGNTFLLLHGLCTTGLIRRIPSAIRSGVAYIGASAGANVACPSISTTNDMPIVYPPSFEGLNLVPFNINPHYFERPPDLLHMGETRRVRIREFQEHHSRRVVGMKEGCILVRDERLVVRGIAGAVVFFPGKKEQIVNPGDDLTYLLEEEAKV